MRGRLLWKLLLVNVLPVIGVIVLTIWVAIDMLAADYFMSLMKKYMVVPTETHRMFLAAVHRYLIWAALAALALALLLSYLLTRRLLRPLGEMARLTDRFAAGDFSQRVEVTTSDEVGQLGRAFNQMADAMARLDQLRRPLVADVAHELRTPLTNLRGYFEGLGDGVIPPRSETFVMLETEVLRLVHLVEEMQQLARADAAGSYLVLEPLSLAELVTQVLGLYRPVCEARGLMPTVAIPPGLDRVRGDRERLLQAIRNLVDNAINYTPAGASIAIYAEAAPLGVRLVFANSGATIPASDLPFIFERFFRADRSRARRAGEPGGAGIGLAIVKSLVAAHGGEVGAASDAAGVRIWFSLPLSPD